MKTTNEHKSVNNEPIYVHNRYGRALDFEAAVYKMDDDIREKLADELTPCTEQEFFDAYCVAHKEAYDEEWFLDDPNPNW